jgi:large subunit ribosomal protein L17
MRKMVFGRQLSRGRKSREALFRSLSQQMVVGGKVTTTKAKAKAVQGDLERLVTLAKQGVSDIGKQKKVKRNIV